MRAVGVAGRAAEARGGQDAQGAGRGAESVFEQFERTSRYVSFMFYFYFTSGVVLTVGGNRPRIGPG